MFSSRVANRKNVSLYRTKLNYLLVILVAYRIFLVVTSTVFFRQTAHKLAWYPDTGSYLAVVSDLSDYKLSSPIYRTPGYPLLIALLDNIFGSWEVPLLLAQLLMEFFVAYMIWLISKAYTSLPQLPVVVYLMHPVALVFSTTFLPATLTAVFLMFSLLVESNYNQNNYKKALLIGLLISLGIAVRPMLIFAGVLYGLYYLILALSYRSRKMIFASIIVILVSNISPQLMKHYNHQFSGLNSISSQSNYEMVRRLLILSGEMTSLQSSEWADSVIDLCREPSGGINYHVRDSVFSRESMRIIKENPLPLIGYHLFGWLRFLGPEQKYLGQDGFYLKIPLPLRILINLFVSGVYAFTISGMILGSFFSGKGKSRNLSLIGLLWFVYAAVVHAKLCYSYYAVPFLGIWITAGYLGWYSYAKIKVQEPNSLLSKIVTLFQRHA